MSDYENAFGQPIGAPLTQWRGCAPMPTTPIVGRYCDVVPLNPAHGDDLFATYQSDSTGTIWTYMPSGPFEQRRDFDDWMAANCASTDPLFFVIIDKANGKAAGITSFLRIVPAHGVVEVGYISFGPALKQTRAATEAMYLMMRRALGELGYRRYEWKCDALNAASRKAALRLGFTYEGTFRQATVYKNRNRDTAWFSVLDHEWPAREAAFEAWLEPENFDEMARQRRSLQMHGRADQAET
ncbi:GNAT family protein [Yoonia sp. SS1-5]|uniref:GNAT family protein n=1 Tax=Yoonia rhodophyticola TaxID=3137370 RepID=A0AAN0NKH8_9RHOB